MENKIVLKNKIKTFKKLLVCCLSALILIFVPLSYSLSKEKKYSIALFSTRPANDPFWNSVANFMKVATDDLGMNLRVYYVDRDHIQMTNNVKDAVTGPNKVNLLVLVNFKKQLAYMLKIAETAKVPAIVFNQGFTSEDHAGKPRQNNKYWIGEVLPNDEYAGELLAIKLIQQAKPGPDKKIHMIALEGFSADFASIERVKGLKKVIKNNKNVVLDQITHGDWVEEPARFAFIGLKRRYPNATVVWAANDNMAMGVIKGAKQLGLKPGKDIIVGGIDWTNEALNAIKTGELNVTVGGHFTDGAWAAIMAYDYLHKKDFKSESTQVYTKMDAITRSNYQSYSKLFNRANWKKIKFRQYSKALNPNRKKYNFGLNLILKQL